jgi:hypothetical protein
MSDTTITDNTTGSGRHDRPLTQKMDEEALRQAYSKHGVTLPKQNPKKTWDKKYRGSKASTTINSRGDTMQTMNETQSIPQVPLSTPSTTVGQPVVQIMKEKGIEVGFQAAAAAAVTAFGIWFSHKLNLSQ